MKASKSRELMELAVEFKMQLEETSEKLKGGAEDEIHVHFFVESESV